MCNIVLTYIFMQIICKRLRLRQMKIVSSTVSLNIFDSSVALTFYVLSKLQQQY